MKILIAEDDDVLREDLISRIPFAEAGYELVGAAANGKEAYELALKQCPQIVLSDIRMPYMDGLELMAALQEALIGCRVILLTGHDEFEYVKKALKLGASDYLLKGEPTQVLLEAMDKARQELLQRSEAARLSALGQRALKERMLTELISSDTGKEALYEDGIALGLDLSGQAYRIAVIRGCGEGGGKPSMEVGREEQLQDYFQTHPWLAARNGLVFTYQHYTVLLFPQLAGETEGELVEGLEKMLDACGNIHPCSFQAGMGRPVSAYQNFSESFDDAIFAERTILPGAPDRVACFQELNQRDIIRKIRDYIHSHYGEETLTLHELSRVMHLSPAYISSLFKRYGGENFKNYLIRLRIEQACRLLEQTDLPAYEVAERVGYPNAQYFSVMFKKVKGISPSEYRNQRKL